MHLKGLFLSSVLALTMLFGVSIAHAAPHSASLSWTASSSMPSTIPSGSGYNIYRSSGACPVTGSLSSPVKLNSAPTTSLVFTDSTPAGGQVYCYLVTAILNGNENPVSVISGNSNFANATIPIDPPTNLTITNQQ